MEKVYLHLTEYHNPIKLNMYIGRLIVYLSIKNKSHKRELYDSDSDDYPWKYYYFKM